MRRLFSKPEPHLDHTTAFFAMAALMMLLLPTLLLSTSTQKLSALPLSIAGSAEELPENTGTGIHKIILSAQDSGFSLQAWVQTTDIRSQTLEEKQWRIQNTKELHAALSQLKKIGPQHSRIILKPQKNTRTEDVVRWMDVIRQTPKGQVLFPEIVIEPAL